jgi:hypothetical protein
LKTAIRYESNVVVVDITHADLKRTLESALRKAGTSRGHFPQVSREVVLEYTREAPEQKQVLKDGRVAEIACEGMRVRNLVVKQARGKDLVVVKNGKLLTPDKIITVATIDYLAQGGDAWFPLTTFANKRAVEGVTDQSSLGTYLKDLVTSGKWAGGARYEDSLDGERIKRVSGTVGKIPEACSGE